MALVNRWPLITDATDVVGGIATTNNGGVTFNPTTGASFNGTNQWLSFIMNIASVSFSLTIWLEFANVTQTCTPFSARNSGNTGHTGFLYTPTGSYFYYDGGGTISSSTDYTSANYPTSQFILCSATYNATTGALTLRRGNTVIISGTKTTSSTPSAFFSIGRSGAYSYGYFAGNALDARRYDTELTSAEIAILEAAGPNNSRSIKNQCYTGGV